MFSIFLVVVSPLQNLLLLPLPPRFLFSNQWMIIYVVLVDYNEHEDTGSMFPIKSLIFEMKKGRGEPISKAKSRVFMALTYSFRAASQQDFNMQAYLSI